MLGRYGILFTSFILLAGCVDPLPVYHGELKLRPGTTLTLSDHESGASIDFPNGSHLAVILEPLGIFTDKYKITLNSGTGTSSIQLDEDMFSMTDCFGKTRSCYQIDAASQDIHQNFDVKVRFVSRPMKVEFVTREIDCTDSSLCLNYDVIKGVPVLSGECPGKQKAIFEEITYQNTTAVRFYEPGAKEYFGEFTSPLLSHVQSSLKKKISPCESKGK